MKIPKKIHLALLLILLVGLLYQGFLVEWAMILDGRFSFKSMQGFLITLLVLLVLTFQYRQVNGVEKSRD